MDPQVGFEAPRHLVCKGQCSNVKRSAVVGFVFLGGLGESLGESFQREPNMGSRNFGANPQEGPFEGTGGL